MVFQHFFFFPHLLHPLVCLPPFPRSSPSFPVLPLLLVLGGEDYLVRVLPPVHGLLPPPRPLHLLGGPLQLLDLRLLLAEHLDLAELGLLPAVVDL